MLTYTATDHNTYTLELTRFGDLLAYKVTAATLPGFAWMYWADGRWQMGFRSSSAFEAVEGLLRRLIEIERAELN